MPTFIYQSIQTDRNTCSLPLKICHLKIPGTSFGFNLAPHLFLSFYDAPGNYLHLQGMSVLPYLNNWLVYQQSVHDLSLTSKKKWKMLLANFNIQKISSKCQNPFLSLQMTSFAGFLNSRFTRTSYHETLQWYFHFVQLDKPIPFTENGRSKIKLWQYLSFPRC